MQSFYYEVLNAEGKSSRGVLSSDSEEEARKILKSQGLTILTLTQADPEKEKTLGDQKVWEFLGKNREGQSIKGTIRAISADRAVERLRDKYNLVLDYLLPAGTEGDRTNFLDQEKQNTSEKKSLKTFLKTKKNSDKKRDPEKEHLDKVHQEIERLLVEFPAYLEANKHFIIPDALRQAEERLGQLARLRHSNAVDNLERLIKELADLVNGKKFFLSDANLSEDARQDLAKRKSSLQQVRMGAEKSLVTSLYRVYDLIAEVPKERILKILWHPLEIVGFIVYMFFFSLFFLLMAFWFYAALKGIVLEDPQFLFLLSSPLLWFLTFFSFIFILMFLWVFIEPRPTLFTRLTFIGAGTAGIGLLILEFPVIFFWTI
jgi:hypothetical protein